MMNPWAAHHLFNSLISNHMLGSLSDLHVVVLLAIVSETSADCINFGQYLQEMSEDELGWYTSGSIERLAEKCGVTLLLVQELLYELVDAGLIVSIDDTETRFELVGYRDYLKDDLKRTDELSARRAQCSDSRPKVTRQRWDHESKSVRELYKNQRGKCFYCKKKVHDKYHVDHVVPLSKGGEDSLDNLVIACPKCNLSKSNSLLEEWNNRPTRRKRFLGLFQNFRHR